MVSGFSRLAQQLWQLGDIGGDAPGLVTNSGVLSSFPSLFRLQRWTELNHSSAGGGEARGSCHAWVMRALIARWVALIAMLGLLALVIATSRIPCVPYGLWPTLQMHCR